MSDWWFMLIAAVVLASILMLSLCRAAAKGDEMAGEAWRAEQERMRSERLPARDREAFKAQAIAADDDEPFITFATSADI